MCEQTQSDAPWWEPRRVLAELALESHLFSLYS